MIKQIKKQNANETYWKTLLVPSGEFSFCVMNQRKAQRAFSRIIQVSGPSHNWTFSPFLLLCRQTCTRCRPGWTGPWTCNVPPADCQSGSLSRTVCIAFPEIKPDCKVSVLFVFLVQQRGSVGSIKPARGTAVVDGLWFRPKDRVRVSVGYQSAWSKFQCKAVITGKWFQNCWTVLSHFRIIVLELCWNVSKIVIPTIKSGALRSKITMKVAERLTCACRTSGTATQRLDLE